MSWNKMANAFEIIGDASKRIGVSFEELAQNFNYLTSSTYTASQIEDAITHNLAHVEADTINIKTDIADIKNDLYCSIDGLYNDIANIKKELDLLRSEMAAKTENPKPKVDLEIFEAIFDNSEFPLLEENLFSQIDFNINI